MAVTAMPKEAVHAYQRWEMTQFDGAGSKKAIFNQNTHQSGLSQQAPQDEASQKLSAILKGIQQQAYDEAYQVGLKNGLTEGLAQAEQQMANEKAQLMQLASQFSVALQERDAGIAEAVLTLSLELAKAMLKTKLEIDPQAVLPIVLDAMHYLPQVQAPARLIVHHEDAKLLRTYLADELAEQHWQVLEDSAIERGGCLVETGENHIDATNDMRWKRITEALSRHDDWHKPLAGTKND